MDKNSCIRCNVSNCEFHAKNDDFCSASEIEVGPHYANSSNDTVCHTFKPSENC